MLFSMFLVKNVNKNKLSSNRLKFKNAQLQFQNPGSYKKKVYSDWMPEPRPFHGGSDKPAVGT